MKNILTNVQNGLQKAVLSKTVSIISGIVCAIPFVFEKTYLLSFLMYVPLFLVFYCGEKSKKVNIRAFLHSFAFFVVGYSFLCELYPLDFAGFTKIEALGVIAFAMTAVPLIHASLFTVCFAVCRQLLGNAPDALKIAVFPCVIVFNEFLQTLGPLAFPWCRVCIAQGEFLPFLQSASLFGSYFIAYIVVLINALAAYALIKPEKRKIPIIIAVSVFVINTSFGAFRLTLPDKNGESFTAVALQGNISSSAKWSGSVFDMLEIYLELSDKALAEADEKNYSKNTLVLMPETALPVTISDKSVIGKTVSGYADMKDVSFVAGAFSNHDGISGNSLFHYDKDGKISKPYTKRVLVPFGEYVPYREVLTALVPALGEINMLSEDLHVGKESCVFETEAGRAGGIICYESVFPGVCRRSVADGAEILLVSTNDSWFGTSSALKHHVYASRLRAIENGVPVIRSANTGISVLVNSDGTFEEMLGADQRGYVLSELTKGTRTLYSYVGDVWIVVCVMLLMCHPFLKLYKDKSKAK